MKYIKRIDKGQVKVTQGQHQSEISDSQSRDYQATGDCGMNSREIDPPGFSHTQSRVKLEGEP